MRLFIRAFHLYCRSCLPTSYLRCTYPAIEHHHEASLRSSWRISSLRFSASISPTCVPVPLLFSIFIITACLPRVCRHVRCRLITDASLINTMSKQQQPHHVRPS
ncbi:hypothetical protein CCUS01_07339 [Colletotrichum cuscutae]|uniref:Uncharacterized protein n=1 Tax=Colletotrichum cuscutae TaxID=1209917 RepID=A0AAI9XZE8_9PEZI|nr:hypothetical protein CCUS01_07339 [Colletotrichum cuscutae]